LTEEQYKQTNNQILKPATI